MIRATVPAIGRAFDNPAHAVYAQARTRKPTRASNKKHKTTKVMAVIRRTAWYMVTSCVGSGPVPALVTLGGAAFVESPHILGLDHCHPVKDWHGTTAGHCLYLPINGGKLGRRERT